MEVLKKIPARMSFMKVIRLPVVLPVILLAVSGCGDSKLVHVKSEDAPASASQSLSEYKVGVDDQLQVTVWRNAELSGTPTVRPDGKITVPLAGEVDAGGRTAAEIAKAIEEKLAVYIRAPVVTVSVTGLRSHEYLTRIRITGAVRSPLSMPFRPGITVLDAVLEAGGPTEFASANRTKVYRKTSDKVLVFDVELDDILRRGRLSTNIELQSGDVVTVPERLF
jgi:polysaccharide export outer membrane protein